MIKQIDIKKFGSYKDYFWSNFVKDKSQTVRDFKKVNILYGRNYSGKTTLSRVFRLLETGTYPTAYEEIEFNIKTSDGEINQATLQNNKYDIRVYNKDFVTENLSFLEDQLNGEIKKFAIVGNENKKITDAIREKESILGSSDEKIGLLYEYEQKKIQQDLAQKNYSQENSELEDKLQKYAKKIKDDLIYAPAVYHIGNIKSDINEIKNKGFIALEAEEFKKNEALFNESQLPLINKVVSFSPNFESLSRTAKELITVKISPTKSIQELLNDNVLQNWVRAGIPLHKHNRDACGFCRAKLPKDFWEEIGAHFNQESENLSNSIDKSIDEIDKEIRSLTQIVTISESQFYSEERSKFKSSHEEIKIELKKYEAALNYLNEQLLKRKSDIFNSASYVEPEFNFDLLNEHLLKINELISRNDEKTSNLLSEKETAKVNLRLSVVKNYIDQIDFDNRQKKIDSLKVLFENTQNETRKVYEEIISTKKLITELNAELKDERKGALKVNELLTNFFGHKEIELIATEGKDEPNIKFEIFRSGNAAYNLSEGECSLIAFCYFIAKLDDIESKGKELLIYIDDPISSLDANHIFFMYSLIESRISSPIKSKTGANEYRYKQLFISTHNLDFLRYLKQLSVPYLDKKEKTKDVEHFLIKRDMDGSTIELMPQHLKEYTTEFNFLFHQIYLCSSNHNDDGSYGHYFSFGNNLRKFLEAFLFYKYPENSMSLKEKTLAFFDNNQLSGPLIFRLENEFSHLTDFDRSQRPIDIAEINEVADFLINQMKNKDSEQLESLLKSIGITNTA